MEPSTTDQVISSVGAVLVLGAYVLNLVHRLDRDGALYAALNLAGSGLLAYTALHSAAIGLVLIEVAWAAVSMLALVRAVAARRRDD
jgi:hypothetical protein